MNTLIVTAPLRYVLDKGSAMALLRHSDSWVKVMKDSSALFTCNEVA